VSKLPPPNICITLNGPPRSKENKGAFGRGTWFNRKHAEIVAWECELNWKAIEEMKNLGYSGPFKGRCRITVAMTYESWKRCDITNYFKSLNDALNGAIWVDDSQVDDARIVRLIDRDDPKVYLMVWFYDLNYETEYPKRKYPNESQIFNLVNYDYVCTRGFITCPEGAKPNWYGKYERLLSVEERKRERENKKDKAVVKVDKRKSIPHAKAQAKSQTNGSSRGSGTSGSSKKSTTRRRKREE
jgi:Holliday junction resolvase RusA-like endonuclease